MDTVSKSLKIFAGIVFPNIAAIKVYSLTEDSTPEVLKLRDLKQPKFAVPWAVERFLWPTFYSTIGLASYMVFKEGGGFKGPAQIPLLSYGVHIGLNYFWTAKPLNWAMFHIFMSAATAAFTSCQFFDVSPTAAFIFLPYVSWLTYYFYYLFYLDKLNTKIEE